MYTFTPYFTAVYNQERCQIKRVMMVHLWQNCSYFLDFADDHQLLTLLVASFQQERTAAVIVLYKAKQRSEKTLDRFLSFPLVSHPLQIHLDMIRAGFEAKKSLYFSFPLNGFGCPGCHLVFGTQCSVGNYFEKDY